jgi:hypothetical protein
MDPVPDPRHFVFFFALRGMLSSDYSNGASEARTAALRRSNGKRRGAL